jgi:hypothetical protein
MAQRDQDLDPIMLTALESDESLQATARGTDAVLEVSDRRLIVKARERIALSVPIEGLRRIQFDIEKRRPATLVIVPGEPQDEPQVLAIPPEEFGEPLRPSRWSRSAWPDFRTTSRADSSAWIGPPRSRGVPGS